MPSKANSSSVLLQMEKLVCCFLVLPHYFFCFHFLTVPLHALLLIFSSLMFWFYFLILMDIILHYHIMLYIHYCIYCSNI